MKTLLKTLILLMVMGTLTTNTACKKDESPTTKYTVQVYNNGGNSYQLFVNDKFEANINQSYTWKTDIPGEYVFLARENNVSNPREFEKFIYLGEFNKTESWTFP